MPGTTPTLRSHLDRAREYLGTSGTEALLLLKTENRRYVTGFTGSAGLALVTPPEALLAVDFRYEEQAAAEAPGWTVLRGGRDPLGALAAAVGERKPRTIGFEAEFVSYAQVLRLREKLAPAELVPLNSVDRLRWVKDAEELAAISRAVEIADQAFVHMLEVLRPGLTERAAGVELESFMRRAGADRVAFDSVVASGPRSALPHGRATDRVMAGGEFVTLDFGAQCGGYCSDCTRTVALRSADDQQRRVYQVVLDAQRRALDMIRPGVPCRSVDEAARSVIAAAGFGEAFGHSLGHGLGLEVHEGPRLSPLEDAVLGPGMVVTVEPGIYLPGWGGVRTEDDVVVTADGCRILTRAPKELRVVLG
ncbi:MAG TPA: Xaa-Pro peptidase family protein [bacterium]|nr:Xaa-Pro peptidase family protein [bacterium]